MYDVGIIFFSLSSDKHGLEKEQNKDINVMSKIKAYNNTKLDA